MPDEIVWQRSSACATNACVEVTRVGDAYMMRNSNDPTRFLTFTAPEWERFITTLRSA